MERTSENEKGADAERNRRTEGATKSSGVEKETGDARSATTEKIPDSNSDLSQRLENSDPQSGLPDSGFDAPISGGCPAAPGFGDQPQDFTASAATGETDPLALVLAVAQQGAMSPNCGNAVMVEATALSKSAENPKVAGVLKNSTTKIGTPSEPKSAEFDLSELQITRDGSGKDPFLLTPTHCKGLLQPGSGDSGTATGAGAHGAVIESAALSDADLGIHPKLLSDLQSSEGDVEISADLLAGVGLTGINGGDGDSDASDLSDSKDDSAGNSMLMDRPLAVRQSGSTKAAEFNPLNTKERLEVVHQVTKHLDRLTIAHSKAPLEIQLQPADLGAITITLSRAASDLSADFKASDPRVAEALDRHRAELASALATRGFAEARINVTASNPSENASSMNDSNSQGFSSFAQGFSQSSSQDRSESSRRSRAESNSIFDRSSSRSTETQKVRAVVASRGSRLNLEI